MHRVVTGWLIVAVCMVLLGLGAFVGAGMTRGSEVPEATVREWRRYAAEVEQGTRTPSAATTRMLTETAIAQHTYARASGDLLRFVGAGVTIVSVLLAIDLVRHRARQLPPTPAPPPPSGD
jgi:hypothetical protein